MLPKRQNRMLNMKRIYVTCSWGESTKQLMNQYAKQTPNNNCRWNEIELVDSIDESDYILMMDGSNIAIPVGKKVIFFGREPAHIALHTCNLGNADIYHHHFKNSWLASTWWVNLDYAQLKNLSSASVKKRKNLSTVESGKSSIPSHLKRKKLVMDIANKYPDCIDIYGHITNEKKGASYKWPLPPKSKETALLPYRYTLAIENGAADFYFTEKFVDPLLCWSMPIYWGSKSISRFFPKGSYHWIDIDDPHAVEKIIDISKSSYREDNIEKISEARELILDKYNLFPTLEKVLKEGRLL